MKRLFFIPFTFLMLSAMAQNSSDDLVNKFFDGLSKNTAEVMDELMPTAEWVKANFDEFKNDPDASMNAVLASRDGWKSMLEQKFQQIVENAQSRKIDFGKLAIGEIKIEEMEMEQGTTIASMEAELKYNGKTKKFSLMGIPIEGGYFLMDIPLSSGVFEKFFED